MTIKALITLAILGSSSVAVARPLTYSASAEASFNFGTARPTTRDHRAMPVYAQPAPIYVQPAPARHSFDARWEREDRYSWNQPRALLLEEGLQFEDHEYRKDVMMDTLGRFNALQITSDGGMTYLMKVVVEFADGGAQQQINLNRTLRGNQGITLDLSGSNRPVHRVLIYRADGAAAHSMSSRHFGGFSVSAL